MANTTEVGCPGGNEGCKRQEVISVVAEKEEKPRFMVASFFELP